MFVIVWAARLVAGISMLIAPFWALMQVWGWRQPWRVRFGTWLGLSIGFGMKWTLPVRALAVAVAGAEVSIVYPLVAPLFGAASMLIGRRLVAAHGRPLSARPPDAGGLGWACLAFAAALAIVLSPLIIGAPLPTRGGIFDGEITLAGNLRLYLVGVVPVALGMAAEAFMLIPAPLATRIGAGAALLGLIALAPLLRGSRWDALYHMKLERAAQLERAEALDAPRRAALRRIVAGDGPALAANACPASELGTDWTRLEDFAEAPRGRDDVIRYDLEWHSLSSDELGGKALVGAFDPADQQDSPAGPHHQLLQSRISASEDWVARTQTWMTPDEARQTVRLAADVAGWDYDATLVIRKAWWPRAVEPIDGNGWDLGELDGSLWIWSYPEQAFVCGGPVRVPSARTPDAAESYEKNRWWNALRLRAVATGVQSLRVVAKAQR